MKTFKRILSIALVLVMTATAAPALISFSPKAEAVSAGSRILYGTYPKTKIDEESELYTALKNVSKEWKEYGYLKGNQRLDSMQYADFWFDGDKYRAVKNNNREGAYGYTGNEPERYYKFETLYWTILDPDTGLMISEYAIDSQPYEEIVHREYVDGDPESYMYRADKETLANTYPGSYIDNWLNDVFYETAFTEIQKDNIVTANMEYDVYDATATNKTKTVKCERNVYLPTLEDVTNSKYGFTSNETRRAPYTDYAQNMGIHPKSGYPEITMLATEYVKDDEHNTYDRGRAFSFLYDDGSVAEGSSFFRVKLSEACLAVRPMICLKTFKHDVRKTCQNHTPDSTWTTISIKTCTTDGLRVKKCVDCGAYATIQRNPAGHIEKTSYTAATCTESGGTLISCRVCGVSISFTPTTPALGHQDIYNTIKEPNCTEPGKTKHTCGRTNCDLEEYEDIPALGHVDENNDGACENCDYVCSCNCHKTGISKFFFSIALFFQKLFGNNKVCACGRNHY